MIQKNNSESTNTQSLQTTVSGSVTSSELRLGNLIYKCYPDGKEIVSVESISKYFINGLGISAIEPIPITEELLLKIGFEVIYRSKFTLRLDHKENFKFGAGWNLVNGHFHIRFIGEQFTNIKHVHELQNLYFSITGLELQLVCLTDR